MSEKEKRSLRKKYRNRLMVAIMLLLLIMAGCSSQPGGNGGNNGADPEDIQLELTLEELAAYDGKDGNPAYIAVDGVIYDVTNSRRWQNGEHNGYTAGQDLTDEIQNISPHGLSVLSNIPVVGKIKE